MPRYTYNTPAELRTAFRRQHPRLDYRKIPNYSGNGAMYKTGTRCAFSDWLDALSKNGDISQDLAQCATLSE